MNAVVTHDTADFKRMSVYEHTAERWFPRIRGVVYVAKRREVCLLTDRLPLFGVVADASLARFIIMGTV